MNKLTQLLFLFFLVTTSACSRERILGIYKTPEDYLNHKLSHQSGQTKIRLYESFNRDRFEVKTTDSTMTYFKNDVFAYVDKAGRVFRFFNNRIYLVLNPGEKIMLYKVTSGTGMKNSPLVQTLYFSKDALSPILLLTLRNIETVFAGELQFEKLVEVHFTKDADLLEYDNLHKMYKLNRLYELSKTP